MTTTSRRSFYVAGALAVGLIGGGAVSAVAAGDGTQYTACIQAKTGTLYSIAEGSAPSKECQPGDPQVSLASADAIPTTSPIEAVCDLEERLLAEGMTFTPNPDCGIADSDGDGLYDVYEAREGTDPHDADTDGDGLSDGDEIHVHSSDPLTADTDNDGLSDSDEVQLGTYVDGPDSDADLLSDGDEVHTYRTDPLAYDTDEDGLVDGEEVNADGQWWHQSGYNSDPTVVDTDGDGLTDHQEYWAPNGPTNPRSADTDGDGFSDKQEVDAGTDATDPNSFPSTTTDGSLSTEDGNVSEPTPDDGGDEAVVTG